MKTPLHAKRGEVGPEGRERGELLYRWSTPLIEGRFTRRYERFVADVRVGKTEVRAHCVNPGRMEGIVVPGARVWLSEAPGRATPYTWELLELDGRLVGVNTALPNKLVGEVLSRGLIDGLGGAQTIAPERAYGRGHRVDFIVTRDGTQHYVEVKNCHLVYPDGVGYFPDSVSVRATKHVEALTRLAKKGVPTWVLFTLQRDDVHALRPSALHDRAFANAMRRAVKSGLRTRAMKLVPTLEGVFFDGEVPVDTGKYDVQQTAEWARALEATSGWVRKDGGVSGRSLPATR